MHAILSFFIYLAGVGLVSSVIVHVCSLLNLPNPLGGLAYTLNIGIFIVWIPAVIAAGRMTEDFKQKDMWKALLRGCPDWMKKLTYFFFAYAFINFFIFIALEVVGYRGGAEVKGDPSLRGFSGHWMAFYSAAMAFLYSRRETLDRDLVRRCPQGHTVSPSDQYCPECGRKIIDHQE